jgi:hypothetical protein
MYTTFHHRSRQVKFQLSASSYDTQSRLLRTKLLVRLYKKDGLSCEDYSSSATTSKYSLWRFSNKESRETVF